MSKDETKCRNHAKEAAQPHGDALVDEESRRAKARQRLRAEQFEEYQRYLRVANIVLKELRAQNLNPQTRGRPLTTSCAVRQDDGEAVCAFRDAPPFNDCREMHCPHSYLMRTRVLRRLLAKYAPGIKLPDVQ